MVEYGWLASKLGVCVREKEIDTSSASFRVLCVIRQGASLDFKKHLNA